MLVMIIVAIPFLVVIWVVQSLLEMLLMLVVYIIGFTASGVRQCE